MELKSLMAAAVCLLFLLATPTPCLTRGGENEGPEVYEIDYRGPETHSYLPPPDRSAGRGRYHNLHHRKKKVGSLQHKSSKYLRLVNTGRREKGTHG